MKTDFEAIMDLKAAQVSAGHSVEMRKAYRGWMMAFRSALAKGLCTDLQGYLDRLQGVERMKVKTQLEAVKALRFYLEKVLGMKVPMTDLEATVALKDAQLKIGHALATRKAYRGWMLRYRHARREKRCRDLQSYLDQLSTVEQVNPKTVKHALNALKLYHEKVLGIEIPEKSLRMPRVNPHKNVPVWLTHEEMTDVIGRMRGKAKLQAELLYGTGGRITALLTRRLKDIDLGRGLIVFRHDKGGKSRTVRIPASVMPQLTAHVAAMRLQWEADKARGIICPVDDPSLARKLKKQTGTLAWYWLFLLRAHSHLLQPCHSACLIHRRQRHSHQIVQEDRLHRLPIRHLLHDAWHLLKAAQMCRVPSAVAAQDLPPVSHRPHRQRRIHSPRADARQKLIPSAAVRGTERWYATDRAISSELKRAADEAGIMKRVGPHVLRHSNATALLERGENIRRIQEHLGHTHVETTEIYTHAAGSESLISPMDMAPPKVAGTGTITPFRRVV